MPKKKTLGERCGIVLPAKWHIIVRENAKRKPGNMATGIFAQSCRKYINCKLVFHCKSVNHGELILSMLSFMEIKQARCFIETGDISNIS